MKNINIYDENNKNIIAKVIVENDKYIEERFIYNDNDKLKEKNIYIFDSNGNLIHNIQKLYA